MPPSVPVPNDCVARRIKSYALVAGFCIFSFSHNLRAWDGPIDPQSWTDLKSEVQAKKTELETLYTQAQNAGLNVERTFVSIETLDRFLSVTQWDYDNPTAIENVMSGWPLSGYYDVANNDHVRLPFDQLEDCLEVADYAIGELNKQLSGEINPAPTVDFSVAHKVKTGPNITMNGRVVFPSKIDLPDSEESFGGFGSGYHYFRQLQDNTFTLSSSQKNTLGNGIISDNQTNFSPITHFHGHNGGLPSWAVNGPYGIVQAGTSPTVYEGGRNFVNYDISNVNILNWLQTLNTDLAASLAQANNTSGGVPMIHMLANEPHFSVSENGWMVNKGGFSSSMIDGFRTWLQDKYGTIGALNTAHGTSYSSFDDYPITVPLPNSMRGQPHYFEYSRFNLDRGNNYFQTARDAVKAGDPSAMITIKLLGYAAAGSSRTGGIDFEYLSNLMDVTGSDYEAVPDTATFFGNAPDRDDSDSWLANFSFHWSVGTQFLDYTKSINPDAPHYNSEWHGISTGSWRDFNMKREYVRAALWIQFTHGLNMINTWWWGRNADGSIKGSSTIGALGTLPVALDEHGRAMKEINAHAETVAAIADQDRFAYIYYSDAAAIQSGETNPSANLIYESLKMLNYSVGMTSLNLIGSLDPDNDFVVVPPMHFLPLAELDAIKGFQNAGGRVILFESNGESFAGKNELGQTRANPGFTADHTFNLVQDPFALANTLLPVTEDMNPARSVPFIVTDNSGSESYGVLVQENYNASLGKTELFLINVSKEKMFVDLGVDPTISTYEFKDLITGNMLQNTRMLGLEPMEIRLLSVSSGENTFTPARDTYVRGGGYVNDNFGSDNDLHCKLDPDNGNYTRRVFTQFELQSFSGNIQSATLRLKVKSDNGASVPHAVYAVSNDAWFESTMSWNTQPAIGGKLDTQASVDPGQWIEFDVTDQVISELAGDQVFSAAIQSEGITHVSYHSMQAANASDRPQLILQEVPANPVLTPARDTYVRGGSSVNINFGSSDILDCKVDINNANYTRRVFTQFDLEPFTGSVQSAKLRLKVKSDNGASVAHAAYAVSDDAWFESSMTWNTQPTIDQMLDTKPSPNPGEWIEFDVTDQVASELAGDKIFSAAIQSEGITHVSYHSKEATNPEDRPQLVIISQEAGEKPTYMIDQNDAVFSWDGSSFTPFGPSGAQLVSIDVGSNNKPWGICDLGDVYSWSGSDWTLQESSGQDIAVTNKDVYLTKTDGTIWHWDGSSFVRFGPLDSQLVWIDASESGEVWGIDAVGNVCYWNGSTWTLVSTDGQDVGVGGGNVFLTKTDDTIWHWDGSSFVPFGTASGRLVIIDAGEDGIPCGVDASANIYEWNASGWSQVGSLGLDLGR